MSERRAIIDIGSNTVRLVVYGGPARAPTVVLNEKVAARLGKDLGRTGAISDKAMAAALAALGRYARLVRMMEVSDVQTVATAASRDASNGAAFLREVRALGLSPRLLTGPEEARASAMGVIGAFPDARGVVADLGGGSLELVRIADGEREHGITLPFGTLRLADLRATGERAFARRFATALREAGWSGGAGEPLYLVGGSWRAFARYMLDLEAQAHPCALDDPHGLELDPQAAQRVARKLSRRTALIEVPGVTSARLAILPDAAALLAQLIGRLAPSSLICSSWGLREGLIYDTLDAATRAQDPLAAGIDGFVARYAVSAAQSDALARLSDGPFDLHAPQPRRIRRAVGALALAAMRVEPNLRTTEALAWALHKRWVGLDNHGRALLAAAIVGSGGQTQLPPEIVALAPPEALAEAVGWGLSVRVARKLTAGLAAAADGAGLAVCGDALCLSLEAAAAPLYTDAVAKDLGALAGWLGLTAQVRGEAPAAASAAASAVASAA